MKREKLIEEINSAGRKMSTATIIFHEAIAKEAGISGTDHKYLDFLMQEGSMTAGRLAELTGLTTGAVTGVIDRLEKQELVERKRDPDDRRKVLVVPQVEKAMEKLGPVFGAFQESLEKHFEKHSKKELEIIRKYMLDTIQLLQENARRLKKNERKEME